MLVGYETLRPALGLISYGDAKPWLPLMSFYRFSIPA